MTFRQPEALSLSLPPQSSARASASSHAIASKVSGSAIFGITRALTTTKFPWPSQHIILELPWLASLTDRRAHYFSMDLEDTTNKGFLV